MDTLKVIIVLNVAWIALCCVGVGVVYLVEHFRK
jgi:hypothetical protein